jgi:hypothetical protein
VVAISRGTEGLIIERLVVGEKFPLWCHVVWDWIDKSDRRFRIWQILRIKRKQRLPFMSLRVLFDAIWTLIHGSRIRSLIIPSIFSLSVCAFFGATWDVRCSSLAFSQIRYLGRVNYRHIPAIDDLTLNTILINKTSLRSCDAFACEINNSHPKLNPADFLQSLKSPN